MQIRNFILALLPIRKKIEKTYLFQRSVLYRGVNICVSVGKHNLENVTVTVNCSEINRGHYTHTGIDSADIESSIHGLLISIKKLIDNHLDYEKNINKALQNIRL